MADHVARIDWESDGNFTNGRYSRAHSWTFDGGTIVPASASPFVVPVPMSDEAGVDPEEALVASVSACHMLWFLSLAQEAGLDVLRYRDDAVGHLGRNENGRAGLTKIILKPEILFAGYPPQPAALRRLHDDAHERCYIANSLRADIVVEM